MTDVEFLFVILAILYAWECLCWLKRGGVAFSTWIGRRWRVQHPAVMLGNQHGGFIFAAPFPPLGSLVQTYQLPFSLSPEGILFFVATNVNPGWRPAQSARFLQWPQVSDLRLKGKKIFLLKQPLLVCPSTTLANHLLGSLNHLAKLSASEREPAIRKYIQASLDIKKADADWAAFRADTKPIRLLTNTVFVVLFMAAPLLIGLIGLRLVWPWLLLTLLALTITTAVLFSRHHRKRWPEADDERFTQTLILALAPASTIRALDVLSRLLLEKFHPLVGAKLFLPAAEFSPHARRLLLDLRHPVLPACPNPQPEAIATEKFFRQIFLESLETWLRENRISPDEITCPLAPADESCHTYCPRCEAQFTQSGNCVDCGGIPLVAFPKAS